MKYNIIYLIIFLLAFSSCNKWLDVTPPTEIPEKEIFTREQGFEDALIGCYIKMNDDELYGESLSMKDIECLSQLWGKIDELNQKDLIYLKQFDYEAETSKAKFKSFYSKLYNIICQSNSVLDNLEITGEVIKSKTKRDIIKGEALALRAFCHFDLLRLFGQVPQNATINVSLPYVDRVSIDNAKLLGYNEYVERIKKDLEEAALLLVNDPVKTYNIVSLNLVTASATLNLDNYLTFRRFRLNYYAVKALQARFYLYIGDNSSANAAAMEIINAKDKNGVQTVSLAGDGDFNSYNNALPTETIFCVYKADLTTKTLNTDKFTISTEQKKDLFTGCNTASNNRYNFLWGESVSNTGQKYLVLKKYSQTKGESDYTLENDKIQYRRFIPMLRLSEVYLIAMESSTNLTELNQLYKTYMLARNEQAVNLDNLSAAKEVILNEYRREFFAEGQMFFAYKRLKSEKMLWSNAKILEQNYIIPVPNTELTK